MRLSLLAGSGALVPAAIAAAQAAGHKVQVLSLTPRVDLTGVKVVLADVSNPLGILWSLKVFRTTHIVMAGAIKLSDQTRMALARFARGGVETPEGTTPEGPLGDAALSHLAISLERMTGAKVVGVHEVVPELLAPAALIAGPSLDDETLRAVDAALREALEFGRLDQGQAIVSSGDRVVATEDAAGTDALIARAGEGRRQGGADGLLILAKAAKPGQPEFVDLPAIGPDTIRNAASAGIRIVAIEAGRSLVIERPRLITAANEAGVSVVGRVIDG